MCYFASGSYQDISTNFTMRVITDNQYFETYRHKFCARMLILADASSGTMNVSWSDDDYITYSTVRTVNMALADPKLTQLGTFKRRAWKLEWTQNYPMRLEKLEVDLNMGSS